MDNPLSAGHYEDPITAIAVEEADKVGADHSVVIAIVRSIHRILADTDTSRAIERVTEPPRQTMLKFPVTVAERAQEFNLSSHIDRYLFATLYLTEERDSRAVDKEAIMGVYDEARWKKPVNPADPFNKAANRIFFVEAEDVSEDSGQSPKLWHLTKTGYDHLMSLKLDEVTQYD